MKHEGLDLRKSLTGDLLHDVASVVSKITGVQFGENQNSMVQFRISKRMLDLGIHTPEEYHHFFREHFEAEVKNLVSLLTTHHTFFFREFPHFDFLENKGLPQLIKSAEAAGRRHLKIWSAAASRGQEVYSLAMFLNVHLARLAPGFTYEILGTDVDPESIDIAKNGVYRWDEVKEIPSAYLVNHWVRGSGEISEFVKAKDSIRKQVRFDVRNLLQLDPLVASGEKFDLIFCRNVFIYFKPEQIKLITAKMLQCMAPDAFLILGLSEHLNGLELPIQALGTSIFINHKIQPKPVVGKAKSPVSLVATSAASRPSMPIETPSEKLRIFCIDDSPTVLTLLKKICAESGFEVAGTAKDGEDAALKLKEAGHVDAVTLDIHMPKMNGIQYLEKHFNQQHPPVVIVSSVAREDAVLGIRALELGAADYVEKPSMSDLTEKADEIRVKVMCAVRAKRQSNTPHVELERSFQKTFELKSTEGKLRIIVAGLGERAKLKTLISELRGKEPATLFLMHGSDKLLSALATELSGKSWNRIEFLEKAPEKLLPQHFYLVDLKKFDHMPVFPHVSICFLGAIPKTSHKLMNFFPRAQVIVEESLASHLDPRIGARMNYAIPVTSMIYHSNQFLSGEKP